MTKTDTVVGGSAVGAVVGGSAVGAVVGGRAVVGGSAVGAVVGGHCNDDVRGERSTFLFKFIMVGDSGVGKSCLLRAYKGSSFLSNMDSTIGVDFFSMKVRVGSGAGNESSKKSGDVEEGCGGIVVKVQIWDTAGHERFKSITQSYYRNAAGCFLVYDLTKPETKDHLGMWRAEVAGISPDVVFIRVGTKCDLLIESESASVGEGVHYCSARTGEGVSEVFGALISKVHKERAIPALEDYRTVPGGGVRASKSGAVPLCSGIVYYPPSFYEAASAHLRAGAGAGASDKDDMMGGNMCPGCAIL